jgi:hypothetical protein
MTHVDRAISLWRLEQVPLLAPLPEAEVIRQFSHLSKEISRDVVQLYARIGGMPDGLMDFTKFSLWSLPKVQLENNLKNLAKDEVEFADYSIDCWRYRFKFEDSSRSSVYVSGGRKLAESVDEFFQLFVDHPEKLDMYR